MANITEYFIVKKVYESFILGKCKCACGTDIEIRSGHYLKKWALKHWYKKGEGNSKWRGGVITDSKGYRKIMRWDHPRHDHKGYVFEHILVYEEYYNVCLLPWFGIHHKDPVREGYCNNDISNLVPVTVADHNRIEKTKDMSGRKCSDPNCDNPDPHKLNSSGYEVWFGSDEEGWKCRKCYMREYDRKRKLRRKSVS